MVLFENEGNARMVTTVPKTQITLMGMERIIPSWDDLEVMATLLPRSATGQSLTVYMSGITGPGGRMTRTDRKKCISLSSIMAARCSLAIRSSRNC